MRTRRIELTSPGNDGSRDGLARSTCAARLMRIEECPDCPCHRARLFVGEGMPCIRNDDDAAVRQPIGENMCVDDGVYFVVFAMDHQNGSHQFGKAIVGVEIIQGSQVALDGKWG